jgi:ATP-dependent protease HslVU (ClpYQ) peptidase subunit
MTTIAIKDGVMACDSLVSAGHSQSMFKFPKVILHNDVYYGFAGACHDIIIMQDLIKGEIDLEDVPDSVIVTYITMPKNGAGYKCYFRKGVCTKMKLPPFYTIGSGSDYALTAMSCGKSATEAVKEAIKWDLFSGGKVKSYSFKTNKPVNKVGGKKK